MRISDVFACVRLLADTAASLPLVAYRHLPGGDRERFSGRLTDLLATPSPGNVTANLIGTIVAHLNLHGNAYIGKFVDGDGIVTQLAPLHPAGMTVQLVKGVPRYSYVDWGGAQELGTAEVLHLKALSVDGVVGLSPVAQARQGLHRPLTALDRGVPLEATGTRVGAAQPALWRCTLGVCRATALLLEQEPRDVLEELPHHVRILLRERPEVPELDRVAAHRRQRLHGGHALALADHRELAEVIAQSGVDPSAVDDDGGLALGDHEEGDTAHLTLLGQQRADGNATLAEVFRQLA